MPMNEAWVINELAQFTRLTDGMVHGDPHDEGIWFVPVGSPDEIMSQWVVVEQILDHVTPGWTLRTGALSSYESEWKWHREVALKSLVIVRRQKEVAENLGDSAPTLSAGRFHSWAWEGARALWNSGHYRSAVEDAAKKVNAECQNKLGRRDRSETALFKDAFSVDPPQPERPRLRRMAPDGSDTYKSMQRGAAALAEGIFAGIRNPFTHESPADISQQHALEYLAALSVLARWVDDSDVERSGSQ